MSIPLDAGYTQAQHLRIYVHPIANSGVFQRLDISGQCVAMLGYYGHCRPSGATGESANV